WNRHGPTLVAAQGCPDAGEGSGKGFPWHWERFLSGDQVAGQRLLGEISTPFLPRGEKQAGDRVRSATPVARVRFLARAVAAGLVHFTNVSPGEVGY
ncbi:unnamed protein product, partial [Ectocarpus sp. 12 AP-2014]